MKREERKAMRAFEEDFILDVVQRAEAKAKSELSRIITLLINSEEFEKGIRDKISSYVDYLVREELHQAVSQVEELRISALEDIASAKKRAFLKLNNYTPTSLDEERIKKLEKTIESLQNEVAELKTRKSGVGGNSTTYNMHGGQMCGTVHCHIVKVYGGQVISIQANKVGKVYEKE